MIDWRKLWAAMDSWCLERANANKWPSWLATKRHMRRLVEDALKPRRRHGKAKS